MTLTPESLPLADLRRGDHLAHALAEARSRCHAVAGWGAVWVFPCDWCGYVLDDCGCPEPGAAGMSVETHPVPTVVRRRPSEPAARRSAA